MNSKTKKETKVILVIEDEQPLLEIIKTTLLKNNFEVVCCRDVISGLKLINDQARIDLVWLDHYLLGKETGIDFVVKIKHGHSKNEIPIFVVSVSADFAKSREYMELGAEKFYTKSDFGLQEIIDDIKNYFKKNNS